MVQWRAFGDQRAYDMMLQGATRHFSRNGYGADDAQLKAASVISEASADPTFAKLIANTFDQEAMLQNDLTSAQVQVGAMEGRRDYAGDRVAQVERGNVATEQAHRRSEEHTSELQSLMRISYAVFCLKTKTTKNK